MLNTPEQEQNIHILKRHQTFREAPQSSVENSSTALQDDERKPMPEYRKLAAARRKSEAAILGNSTTISIERTHSTNPLSFNSTTVLNRRKKEQILLETLDLVADEVQQNSAFDNRFNLFRGNLSVYSSIRETYRLIRATNRETELSRGQRILTSIIVFLRKLILSVNKFLQTRNRISLFIQFEFFLDLFFCIAYLFELNANIYHQHDIINVPFPYFVKVYRSFLLFNVLAIFSGIILFNFILRLIYATDKIKILMSLNSFLDLVICVPIFILRRIDNGIYIYLPYFLRILVVLEKGLDLNRRQKNPVLLQWWVQESREKILSVLYQMGALIYIAVCSFQYSEFNFGQSQNQLTLMESFYFIMITITTVGYGDITPKTIPGQWIIITTVLIALGLLPGFISAIVDAINAQRAGKGSFNRHGLPFIVVAGAFENASHLKDLLNEFYYRKTGDNYVIRIVILSSVPATDTIKTIMQRSSYRDRVTFLHGSAVDEDSLSRIKLDHALAAFIIPEINTLRTRDEQDRMVLKSLAFSLYAPNTPLFVYNLLEEGNILQSRLATCTICLNSLKQMLLAYNCVYRGTGTLLINLLRQSSLREAFEEPWQAQYNDGLTNSIYTGQVNDIFVGHSFSNISSFLYNEFQVILFGVNTLNGNGRHLLLNPGNSYLFKEDDDCLFIAQSINDIQNISNLNEEEYKQSESYKIREDTIRNTSNQEKYTIYRQPTGFVDDTEDDQIYSGIPTNPAWASWTISTCKLLKIRTASSEMVISDASNWTGHVLICTKSFEIFQLICTLRSSTLTKDECKKILILSDRHPSSEELYLFSQFPSVYVIFGKLREHKADLVRAGIETADKVIILNLLSDDFLAYKEDGHTEFSDSNTIMLSHNIYSMFKGQNKKYVVHDLQEKESIKFLRPTSFKTHQKLKIDFKKKHERIINQEDYYVYTPTFASGRVIAQSMMESILYQSFFNSSLVDVFRYFCGIKTQQERETDSYFLAQAKTLCYIIVPPAFIGQPFNKLFHELNIKHNILALGLFRDEISVELENRLPFVYTNPLPCLLLKSTDLVYVLASDSQLA